MAKSIEHKRLALRLNCGVEVVVNIAYVFRLQSYFMPFALIQSYLGGPIAHKPQKRYFGIYLHAVSPAGGHPFNAVEGYG